MTALPATPLPSTSATVTATAHVLSPLSDREYQALLDDIRERGVLVPVEITEDGEVLDGTERLRAARELGITSYPRVVRSGLTAQERIAHRLAVNTHRRHLTASQRRAAVLALSDATGWSTRRLSAATGVSQSTVARILGAVPDEPTGEPSGSPVIPRVTGADGKSYPARRRPTSVFVTTRAEEARARDALATLGDRAPGRPVDLRRAERLVRDAASQHRRDAAQHVAPVTTVGDRATVAHCDIRDLPVDPGTADLILTDPDYTAAGMAAGTFEDLAEMASVWLRPGGLLVAYSGQMHLPDAITALGRRLTYWWTYAVLGDASSGVGQVRQRGLGTAWKPLLVYRQPGGVNLPPWTLDVIRGPGRAKASGHAWEQAQGEAEQIITTLTKPGDLVVDPYSGSGTTAAAAVQTGRRAITGDHNPAAVHLTLERLAPA
ncbi:DNA methyltransferase [Knoellia sp. LjRoot47]|uniref:ParB/RepB/Spo0J family partition protein n=1 Tax=Knoellia sp. LjRoot47 TaxID=3342330 RepID=UPI003ECEB368